MLALYQRNQWVFLMQKGHTLEFICLSCSKPVQFSIFSQEDRCLDLTCQNCDKKYLIDDEVLLRQMCKFAALCKQLIESEEILSHSSIGIDIADHHVKIPYKLLLTRFNSCLDLKIGDQPLQITFRIEPLTDAICVLA